MTRQTPRLFMIGLAGFFVLILFSSVTLTSAQSFGDNWVEDSRLHIYLEFDNRPIVTAGESNPIIINQEEPMTLYLQLNVTNDVPLNISGQIWFYYNGIAVFPLEVRAPGSNSSWLVLPHDYPIPGVAADLNMGELLSVAGIPISTGIFQVSLNFSYYEMDSTDASRSSVLHTLGTQFYVSIPPESIIDVITTPAGAAATVATIGAVTGLGKGIWTILDGIQTAHKVRSIQKKASEIRSLPNLTVLGALPALFAIVAGMTKLKKKKSKEEDTESDAEKEQREKISEYRLRQRLREVAPESWPQEKCPNCLRKWSKDKAFCKKCNLDTESAKRAYTEVLLDKVEPSLKLLNKKKSISVRKLAKKTKSNEYNAGVVAAAMVDVGLTEVSKVETPIKSFVLNVGGLLFLVLTWQQLLGGAASQWQTTLTIVGAGMSLAVIVALFFARRTQVKKLRAEIELDDMDGDTSFEELPPPEQKPAEENDMRDMSGQPQMDSELKEDESDLELQPSYEQEHHPSPDDQSEEPERESLTPEELEKEKK
ncbi:hypothetical protein EU537_09730 [Candidatus Thorarchaeota archaeon]|nr:MAG: hypothetical protein EU537_09730 [Candidatus Thorarchaeota archaeon]